MSLWPLRYLVVLWRTTSAPSFERALEDRRREGVVHHEQVAVGLGEVADGGEIGQRHHRVGGRFAVDHPGLGSKRLLEVPDVPAVHEGEREPELGVDPLHQPVAAAVQVFPADHVVAALEHLEHRVQRREARSEREAVGRRPRGRPRSVPAPAGSDCRCGRTRSPCASRSPPGRRSRSGRSGSSPRPRAAPAPGRRGRPGCPGASSRSCGKICVMDHTG